MDIFLWSIKLYSTVAYHELRFGFRGEKNPYVTTVTLQPSWYPKLVELMIENVIVDVEKADE